MHVQTLVVLEVNPMPLMSRALSRDRQSSFINSNSHTTLVATLVALHEALTYRS